MYEGLPGGVKTFLVRGLIFPNEEEFSFAAVRQAVGSKGYSPLSGTALHSVIAGSFCFSEAPLHEVGSW